MQTPKEMSQNSGMTPVGQSIDQPQNTQDNALSAALKQRRINKANKRRMVAPNEADDQSGSITNPEPNEE
jgi:hypothetical protein